MKQLTTPATLEQGKRYAGIAKLTSLEHSFASPSDVVSKMQGIGFTDVEATIDTPPADWPASAAIPPKPSSGGYAFALATWPSATTTKELPSAIVAAWELDAGDVVAPPPSPGTTPATPPKGPGSPFVPLSLVALAVTEGVELVDELLGDLFG